MYRLRFTHLKVQLGNLTQWYISILYAVTQQPSSPQQQPAGVQHQLLSSATGHQSQFGNLSTMCVAYSL